MSGPPHSAVAVALCATPNASHRDAATGRKNFFAKRRMRAGRCGLGHTSPTLGVGGNLLCKIVQFGFFGGAHASRVLVSASRRNNLFSNRERWELASRKKSPRRRDTIANTRDARTQAGKLCATQSDLLSCSALRRSFALGRKPRRLLRPAKRKLSKSSCLQRVLIFRSTNLPPASA